jgi:hypothetical protein
MLRMAALTRMLHSISKNRRRAQALRRTKKEQGGKPCSKNCVDPISPKIGFDLD